MNTELVKVASFSDGEHGGNPAGVFISEQHPEAVDMQAIAADIGYSETAFAQPTEQGWRVRYFSPESEVPFCGHATIALGAVLCKIQEPGIYALELNNTTITVEGFVQANQYSASLQSPTTSSKDADPELLSGALSLFGYNPADLNPEIPSAFVNAGANHLALTLNNRQALSDMKYSLEDGRQLMNDAGIVTIMLAYSESASVFHTRNPFASGGVYEDPATGAATAAYAGYLRDLNWPHGGVIDIVQGEDMGSRSLIQAKIDKEKGSSIRVSGSVRFL